MTRSRDTAEGALLAPWRVALAIPGALLVERLLTQGVPAAVAALGFWPAALRCAAGAGIVLGLALWHRAVLREGVTP